MTNSGHFILRLASLLGQPQRWPFAARRLRHVLRHGQLLATLRNFSKAPLISPASYNGWIKARHAEIDPAQMRRAIDQMANPPLFSILMPVWNPEPDILRAALNSVTGQIYPHWQLCLVDNGSSRDGIREVLMEFSGQNDNIDVILLDENSGIANATNRALEIAKGNFVTFLDHDDLLAPQALFAMASAIVEDPKARLLYSDEDKVGPDGTRFSPYFKPDFDLHLLLAQNYMCHLLVVCRKLALATEGLRPAFDGAQDHDFALRCVECLDADAIIHVPQILYHWRVHKGSTALGIGAKDYAIKAGDHAVMEHFRRLGLTNISFEHLPNHYRQLRFSPASPLPIITIIIPTKNQRDLLETCIDSLFGLTDYPAFDVIVIDNDSDDLKTREYLQKLPQLYQGRIKVMPYDKSFNYAEMNNLAAQEAKGKYLCFMNNDIEIIESGWLRELAGALLQPGIGACAPRLLYPDGLIQHNGILVGFGGTALNLGALQREDEPGYFGQLQLVREVSAVSAACMITATELFLDMGGLDAKHFPVAFNDVDYCLRLRERGHKILICPPVRLIHHESASLGEPASRERAPQYEKDMAQFKKHWQKWIDHDPAYNPNLALAGKPHALAEKPRGKNDCARLHK